MTTTEPHICTPDCEPGCAHAAAADSTGRPPRASEQIDTIAGALNDGGHTTHPICAREDTP